MKFCRPVGTRFMRAVASTATMIKIKSTMIVVMKELVSQRGAVEVIGTPDNSTCGGGTFTTKKLSKSRIIAPAHKLACIGLAVTQALNLSQTFREYFWMDSMLVIPFGDIGSA